MIWSDFLKTHSQEVEISGYLEILAKRTMRLEQRLQQLQAENQQLRQQLAKLDTPSIEQLLDFLPAFFYNKNSLNNSGSFTLTILLHVFKFLGQNHFL